MLTDHACGSLFRSEPAAAALRLTIGRIAFPVFAFLLVEGFFHTRSRMRYALSILITAVITEVFYDLAMHDGILYLKNQNICFTLFTGLIMFCVMDRIYYAAANLMADAVIFLQLAAGAAFCLVFYFQKLDYSYKAGILFMLLYFLYRQKDFVRIVIPIAVFAVLMQTAGALLAAVPLLMYNGSRGPITKPLKWFFYAIYPLQFVVLYLIRIIFRI